MTRERLSDEEVRALAEGSDTTFTFDFSAIDSSLYEPLLKTLQHFALRRITDIGFSCDRLAREEENSKMGIDVSKTYRSSIANNRKHYVRNITELLYHVLTRSKILKSLTLSNIRFTYHQVLRLAEAFARNTCLQRVTFSNVPFGNEGLFRILDGLDVNIIRSVSMKGCGLGNDSVPKILSFIEGKSDPRGLQEFVVSREEISDANIARIAERISLPSFEIDDDRKSIRALVRENEELKKELKRLRRLAKIVQVDEDVFVVGKRAEQFVEFLQGVEGRLKDLEDQKSMMLASFL
jgi:regulator of replication initiation timing